MIRGAVLGSPISHSLSPVLHRAAFESLGVEGSYEAIDVPSGTLSEFFLRNQSEYDYLSLTMPPKEEAHLLQGTCDELSLPNGLINNIKKKEGVWFGYLNGG